MNRQDVITRIKNTDVWDIVVIGGGASGLGIALESATRGYATLLVEQSDFAKSTSSKSTKLVHGGVRYLAQGNIALVREATIERGLLSRNAAHLVKNQKFIIPVYNWWSRLKYTLGLKIYDWIAGRLSLGSSTFISRNEVLQQLPGINPKNLFGGILYHDGQFDDARLAINLAQTIFDNGGYAVNYTKVVGLLKEKGKICGVKILDFESGGEMVIKAKVVINATGVFADNILSMDEPGLKKNISVSQGVHLVLDKKFFTGDIAMMIPETIDGRVLFIVPWHNKLLLGTTDTPVKNISLEPVALQAEIDFILTTASGFLTLKPTREDILSVFAGLRPLAAVADSEESTKEISRSHKVLEAKSGLLSMVGGKWTTYRKMGEDMIDKVEKNFDWKSTISVTDNLLIHGSGLQINQHNPLYFYGTDEPIIRKIMSEETSALISDLLQVYEAQVIWAVRQEMAITVEDVLSRRTRSLLLDASESIRIGPFVAAVMAKEMNKDDNWKKEEIEKYIMVAGKYLAQQE